MPDFSIEMEMWVAGIKWAWYEEYGDEAPVTFVIESIHGAPSTDFLRRHQIMVACFAAAPNQTLPKDQAKRLVDSCMAVARRFGSHQVVRWKEKLARVHQACQELLKQEEDRSRLRPKRRSKKKSSRQECVICLDAEPDYEFQPCGHCVSCAGCAAALRAKSSTCPWCRGELE